MGVPQIFSSNPLDRGERERRDEAWIDQASRDRGSKFLPLWNLRAPLSTGDDAALVWLSFEDLSKLGIQADPVLLGLMDGTAHFAIDVSELEKGDHALRHSVDGVFEDARNAAVLLSAEDAGVLCQAAAQINWHGSHGLLFRVWAEDGDEARRADAAVPKLPKAALPSHRPRGHHGGIAWGQVPAGTVSRTYVAIEDILGFGGICGPGGID